MPTQASLLFGSNIYAILKAFGGGDINSFSMDPRHPVMGPMVIVKKGVPLGHPPPPPKPRPTEQPKAGEAVPGTAPKRKLSPESIFAIILVVLLASLAGLALLTPRNEGGLAFLTQFFLFTFAVALGIFATLSVVVGLQSPLMSLTNAISGLLLLGGNYPDF
ncbi:hypothetical protein GEMRC1_004957 [Eukaryota sp. GEM-RC1]